MQTATQLPLTAEDFLAWEETQLEKHEFVAGEVFAMTGSRQNHVLASGNIYAALKQGLSGTTCRAYIDDMKLRLEAVDAFFYPDAMVSGHPKDLKAKQFLSHPSLHVEVLSDSTANDDRGAKFVAYRKLESLQDYLIVDIDNRSVECFRRTADNECLLNDYSDEVECPLSGLDFSLSLTEIFEDIESV